jgi:hypothetical protein
MGWPLAQLYVAEDGEITVGCSLGSLRDRNRRSRFNH